MAKPNIPKVPRARAEQYEEACRVFLATEDAAADHAEAKKTLMGLREFAENDGKHRGAARTASHMLTFSWSKKTTYPLPAATKTKVDELKAPHKVTEPKGTLKIGVAPWAGK